MKRAILGVIVAVLTFVSLSVWAQQTPEHRDDKYKDDPHAFCWKNPEDPDYPSAHACSCAMVCGPDTGGNQVQQETTACAMYCSKQRCSCHADEPCDGPDVL